MMKKLGFLLIAIFAFSFTAIANDSELLQPLDKKDKLLKTVERINALWGDGNISTGTTRVYARALKADLPRNVSEFKELSQGLFREDFKYQVEADVPVDVKFRTFAKKFSDSDVEDLVKAAALGNAYDTSNPENFKDIRRQSWVVIRQLGESSKIQTLVTKASIYSDTTSSMKKVFSFVFINRETKKVVVAFIIEGTM